MLTRTISTLTPAPPMTTIYDDVKKYGAYQAQKWVKQGKYNLPPEELEKEHKRIQEKLKKLYDL